VAASTATTRTCNMLDSRSTYCAPAHRGFAASRSAFDHTTWVGVGCRQVVVVGSIVCLANDERTTKVHVARYIGAALISLNSSFYDPSCQVNVCVT
jgi:hypothetical protein